MRPANEENDDLIKKTKYIEKMESYLKAKEEIFDFIIKKKVIKLVLFYFSSFSVVLSLLLFFGGTAFIEFKIKDVIDKKVAKEINVEADYLKRRNEITYLGDMAVSEGYIPSYEELERIYKNSDDKKIKQAAKAEIVRVELLLSIPFDYYPINKLEYISNGKTSIGKNIETSILVDMIKQSKDIGKITTIIEVLFERKHEKNLPQVLLNIGRDTDHLQIRYTALFRVQALVEDFTANPYNYEEFSKWWLTSGKNKWGERK